LYLIGEKPRRLPVTVGVVESVGPVVVADRDVEVELASSACHPT
jgi:hypothetical protein